MALVALGLLGFILFLLVAKLFVGANPAALAKGLRWAGIGLAVAGIGVLSATGRVGFAGLAVPLIYSLVRGWRPGQSRARASRPSPGQRSSIRTDYLELTLDHDSGDLSGEVLRGRFAGRGIAALGEAELIALWQETGAADPPSAQLVETCLDRRFPDWREAAARTAGAAPPPRGGAMSRAEALRILGLEGDPAAAAVIEAHRRLMMAHHPDRGGSAYLAALINEAKQVLTGPG